MSLPTDYIPTPAPDAGVAPPTPKDHLWWQSGVVYQIYPRSFMDSNGDGIGDLPGIIEKLDYLTWLGVDAVWISPFYPSPMADFGYDVSDYTDIHPIFGTMADFDRLREETRKRGLKLILDFVPNHTSSEHPWFLESRSSRDNPKRDWYIWHDALPDGDPPNNWRSVFGGSAWEWDEKTGQYYLHSFLKEQPDLNWRNPEVERAMLDVLRFWLDRGVDGFRVDVMWHMVKDAKLRDNPLNPDYVPGQPPYEELLPVFSTDQPEVHDIVRRMRALVDEYDERLIIGEIYLPITKLVTYYGEDGRGAHLPFNFHLITLPWDALHIGAAVSEYEGSLPEGGWPNWVLGNHDQPRVASRIGPGQARVAAMLLLTLRGTPTLYYGDELGMHDVAIPPERIQDPQALNMPGVGRSRDTARTPMQWTPGEHAGFSTAEPWLPVSVTYRRNNVELQRDDPYSMLSLHRRLLELRRIEPALSIGSYTPVPSPRNVLAYLREAQGRRFLVMLNLSHAPAVLAPEHLELVGEIVCATYSGREGTRVERRILLEGDEGVVVRLD
ncbi:MAG TPA: alpha-amylase family glycosyl hydrolase [Gemmatimonadaceae bacterium]|nr:alpha-amylase family glycosyl hydrolase [Gemmatimonadaceae bacterium]